MDKTTTRREIAEERLYFRWLYRARRKTGEEPSADMKRQKMAEIKGPQ